MGDGDLLLHCCWLRAGKRPQAIPHSHTGTSCHKLTLGGGGGQRGENFSVLYLL